MVLKFGLMSSLSPSLSVTEYPDGCLGLVTADTFSLSFSCDSAKVHLISWWANIWMHLQEVNSQEWYWWRAMFGFLCGAMCRVSHHSVNNDSASRSHKEGHKKSSWHKLTVNYANASSRTPPSQRMTEWNTNRCFGCQEKTLSVILPSSWLLKEQSREMYTRRYKPALLVSCKTKQNKMSQCTFE